ncbi:hypothetical protein [Amycolatopsis sp. cmx-4-54]|uniref:hypothetical protein n=1 Tax=Amycolatopsis sp. cmx-4-54 TaxID=2790936 RepID=UPI0039780E51
MRVWWCGLVVGAVALLGACAGGGSGQGKVVPSSTATIPTTGLVQTTSRPPETPVTTTTRSATPTTTRATTQRTTTQRKTTANRPTPPRRTPPRTR